VTLSFLGYVLSTKLPFRILCSSESRAHPSKDYDEQKAVVKHHYQGCQKRGSMLKYLGGEMAYVQVRLTLIFSTVSCGLKSNKYRIQRT